MWLVEKMKSIIISMIKKSIFSLVSAFPFYPNKRKHANTESEMTK